MLGGVGGRHVSQRRRGSNPVPRSAGLTGGYGTISGTTGGPDGGAIQSDVPKYAARRRRAVTTSDHKSCALIQTRLKLGDIMWVEFLSFLLSLYLLRISRTYDGTARTPHPDKM